MRYCQSALFQALWDYYSARQSKALTKGLDKENSKYHWLYTELGERISTLSNAKMFMESLPLFMKGDETSEKTLTYVTTYVGSLFKGIPCGGLLHEGNLYWDDFMEISDEVDQKAELAFQPQLPQFYLALCEYIMRCLRLYFFVREKCICSVDRDNFDSVMEMKLSVPA